MEVEAELKRLNSEQTRQTRVRSMKGVRDGMPILLFTFLPLLVAIRPGIKKEQNFLTSLKLLEQ